MDIRPIRTERDHAAALAEIARLWAAKPGSPEHDRLEILGALASAYEDKRWPTESPHPIALLKTVMAERGLTQAALAKAIGSRSRASEILSRKRHLTLEMVWALSRKWHIPAECLIKPYKLREPRRHRRAA